mmetsp:Transcript_19495/g.40838  ORF Transcript_19495/g.40838 Transcript_19495/m.40838 type:complete len:310 (-) Transcript_19495:7-936(-)
MHIININCMNLDPSILSYMVQVVDTSTHGITMTSMVNSTLSQINRLFHGQVRPVISVQYTIRVRRTRANREVPPLETRPIIIHVIQLGSRLIPPRNHRSHAQPVSTVRTHRIRQQLGRRSNGNPFLISQLIHSALHSKIALPKGAICGSSGHGPEKERVDFNNLFDSARGDVGAHGGAGVDTDDDSAVKFECEGGGSFSELDSLVAVAVAAGGGEVVSAKVRGIGYIWYIKLSRLSKDEAWWADAARPGSARPISAIKFTRSNIEDVVFYNEGGSEHGDVSLVVMVLGEARELVVNQIEADFAVFYCVF